MLDLWQKKFPHAFEENPTIMLETTPIKTNISTLFSSLESKALLNENIVNALLQLHCSSDSSALNLHEGLCGMIEYSLFSLDVLTLLCNIPAPAKFMQFILQTRASDIDFETIQHLLTKRTIIDGLSRTINLFNQSYLAYSLENINRFSVLAEVLANPLCQTIFDARLRTFSDYAVSSDHIDSTFAAHLINQLYTEKNEQTRIAIFFDAFTTLRSFPLSQKYMIDIDMANEVTEKLTTHCLSVIKAIDTSEDYEQARCMIKDLQTTGGNQAIFNLIKYPIATTIELKDFYSRRSFHKLMDEIKMALYKPQIQLSSFAEELQCSKGCKVLFKSNIAAPSPRVPEFFTSRTSSESTHYTASMIDLETTGLHQATAVDSYSVRSEYRPNDVTQNARLFNDRASNKRKNDNDDETELLAAASSQEREVSGRNYG